MKKIIHYCDRCNHECVLPVGFEHPLMIDIRIINSSEHGMLDNYDVCFKCLDSFLTNWEKWKDTRDN